MKKVVTTFGKMESDASGLLTLGLEEGGDDLSQRFRRAHPLRLRFVQYRRHGRAIQLNNKLSLL